MFRKVIKSLLPKGPLWRPDWVKDLEKYYQGIADFSKTIKDFLAGLADLRNPYKTPLLEELEKDYGHRPNEFVTEAERRAYIASLMAGEKPNGSRDYLQKRLHQAGFTNLFVHENNPAVDPALIAIDRYLLYCGDSNAYCGEPTAELGAFSSELIVNGDLYQFDLAYKAVCGGEYAYCGEPDFICGELYEVTKNLYQYQLPTDPTWWPAVFFVGGEAEYAPDIGSLLYCGDSNAYCGEPTAMCQDFQGGLLSVRYVDIPLERRAELRRIILKFKPVCSWGVLLVSWT